MADTQQDLLGLQYSPSFSLQGLQEEDVNLTLPPCSLFSRKRLRLSNRRYRPHR